MSIDLAELHLHWGESRHKGTVYRSYSLARAYRKDGKNRKETVLKLGKLSDQAAQRWRMLLKPLPAQGFPHAMTGVGQHARSPSA